MCTSSVSIVIYHKFSYGVAFYTLNGKNVNVMLEYPINEVDTNHNDVTTHAARTVKCSRIIAFENGISFEEQVYHVSWIFKKSFFLTRELSLINTCCWRADHEILMHDGGAGVH